MNDRRSTDDDALDEVVEESFPASDAPANTVETGVRLGEVPRVAVATNKRESQRFELTVDGHDPAFLTYELKPGSLVILHTEVPPSLRGRHIGDTLVTAAVDFARQ